MNEDFLKLIDHLPDAKQVELTKIVTHILSTAKVEMVILYGSFARGDWVEDSYMEDYIRYQYQSDYDILVVVKNQSDEKLVNILHKIKSIINKDQEIITPTSIDVENIDFVNENISLSRYLYLDMIKEGIILFDSGNVNLAQPKKLSKAEKKQLAKVDMDLWFPKGFESLDIYKFCVTEPEVRYGSKQAQERERQTRLNWGAFHLHQATESFLVAFLLVFTGYREKTHNIDRLLNVASGINEAFTEIFPRKSPDQKHLFNLLNKAYIDARYKKRYRISQNELEYLEERIRMLKDLVEKLCEERIEST